jgi:Skp family chaperone for outer membrane proteins
MKISECLKRIQNLPLIKRKVIFWIIMIIFGLILFTFYIMNIKQKIKAFPMEKTLEELKLPELKEKLKELPKPKVEEGLKGIKKDIGEIEKLLREAEEKQREQY